MKKIHLFALTTTFFILLVLVNLFALESFYEEFFLRINASLFEPLIIFSLGLVVASGILLFFDQITFRKWLSKIFIWYLPLALLIVSTGSTGSNYAWIQRTDLAVLTAVLLVVITAIFAFLQRFYFKTK